MTETSSITSLQVENNWAVCRSPDCRQELDAAITDLLATAYFVPEKMAGKGPWNLKIGVRDAHLFFDIRDMDDVPVTAHLLSLSPLRQVLRDYYFVCENWKISVQDGRRERREAVDMGRRSLHDEGARILSERLEGKVHIDHATARRLFTILFCIQGRGQT